MGHQGVEGQEVEAELPAGVVQEAEEERLEVWVQEVHQVVLELEVHQVVLELEVHQVVLELGEHQVQVVHQVQVLLAELVWFL